MAALWANRPRMRCRWRILIIERPLSD